VTIKDIQRNVGIDTKPKTIKKKKQEHNMSIKEICFKNCHNILLLLAFLGDKRVIVI